MDLIITGKYLKSLPEATGTGRNGVWVKQNFVIETGDLYPRKVCFVAWGDKTTALKQLNEGDQVKIQFTAESREFNERWYTDLRAVEIERLSAGAPGVSNNPAVGYSDQNLSSPGIIATTPDDSDSDLPF
ncbi:MAG: DUF3127 domain-containing protein [Sphingobacteriia bacterium]|nr:DUF3127 domain-containing protein [Sphingobacteriia bacterium]